MASPPANKFSRISPPMMQLGHLFAGQVIVYLSLLVLIVVAESRAIPVWIEHISRLPFLRVSGAKGIFYFLFSSSMAVIGFTLETARSVAKIYRNDRMKYKIIKSQRSFTYMSSILFVNFLGTYIFNSLTNRTMNLLMLGLATHICCSMSALLGLDILNTFFYLTFVMANVGVLLLTYFVGFDSVFMRLGHCFRGLRFPSRS